MASLVNSSKNETARIQSIQDIYARRAAVLSTTWDQLFKLLSAKNALRLGCNLPAPRYHLLYNNAIASEKTLQEIESTIQTHLEDIHSGLVSLGVIQKTHPLFYQEFEPKLLELQALFSALQRAFNHQKTDSHYGFSASFSKVKEHLSQFKVTMSKLEEIKEPAQTSSSLSEVGFSPSIQQLLKEALDTFHVYAEESRKEMDKCTHVAVATQVYAQALSQLQQNASAKASLEKTARTISLEAYRLGSSVVYKTRDDKLQRIQTSLRSAIGSAGPVVDAADGDLKTKGTEWLKIFNDKLTAATTIHHRYSTVCAGGRHLPTLPSALDELISIMPSLKSELDKYVQHEQAAGVMATFLSTSKNWLFGAQSAQSSSTPPLPSACDVEQLLTAPIQVAAAGNQQEEPLTEAMQDLRIGASDAAASSNTSHEQEAITLKLIEDILGKLLNVKDSSLNWSSFSNLAFQGRPKSFVNDFLLTGNKPTSEWIKPCFNMLFGMYHGGAKSPWSDEKTAGFQPILDECSTKLGLTLSTIQTDTAFNTLFAVIQSNHASYNSQQYAAAIKVLAYGLDLL